MAVLDGIDALVFTGGVGEHSDVVRARVCAGFGHLGLALDAARNAEHASLVSTVDSRVTVRVVPTDEELVIARHAHTFIDP